MSAKQLACCAMAMALALLLPISRFLSAMGGSVTLCSMLFIVLVANWYGVRTGILVGFTYGMLQFLQEPYVLSLFQVCCDYVLAFAALGVAGFFAKQKNGLLKGYIVGCSSPGERFMRWRIFVLDGLHAGQFPEITCSRISDRI